MTETTKNQVADYILRVPKDRKEKDYLEIGLKELDEPTFIAAQQLLSAGKETESIRFLVRQLRVSGDDAEEFCANFLSVRAATLPLVELIKPLEGELKKN